MKIHHRRTTGLFLLVALLLAQTVFCVAHENPNAASSRWLDKVAKRKPSRHSGWAARPWVCQNRAFFPQLPFGKRVACCGNRCVNMKIDENNCGRCGKRCPFSWQCIDPKSNPFHCGACSNRCAAGSRCTLGLCGYATQHHPFPRRGVPPRRNQIRRRHHRRHHHSRS